MEWLSRDEWDLNVVPAPSGPLGEAPHPHPGSRGLASIKRLTTVEANQTLFCEGETQPSAVQVVHGVVRAVRLLEGGERQVVAFFWPGDTMGIEQVGGFAYSAEAVTRCHLRCLPPECRPGNSALGSECNIVHELLNLVTVLGRKSVISRVAWFLLRVRPRLPKAANTDEFRFEIPQSDVADYLGTSKETVCRMLSEFRERGLIELPTRRTIRFLDERSLDAIARGL